jgi:hypothetical protein
MPRPPDIIRPTQLRTSIPMDLRAWLDLHLWSDSELRVPHGAYQKLIVRLIREYKDSVEGKPNATDR